VRICCDPRGYLMTATTSVSEERDKRALPEYASPAEPKKDPVFDRRLYSLLSQETQTYDRASGQAPRDPTLAAALPSFCDRRLPCRSYEGVDHPECRRNPSGKSNINEDPRNDH